MSSGRRELRDVDAPPLALGARLRLLGRVAGVGAVVGTGVLLGTGSLDLVRGPSVPNVEGAREMYLVPVRPRIATGPVEVVVAAPVLPRPPVAADVEVGTLDAPRPAPTVQPRSEAAAPAETPMASSAPLLPGASAMPEPPPTRVEPAGVASPAPVSSSSSSPEGQAPPAGEPGDPSRADEPATQPADEDPFAAGPVEAVLEPVQGAVDSTLAVLG